jgi:hypothetical protein
MQLAESYNAFLCITPCNLVRAFWKGLPPLPSVQYMDIGFSSNTLLFTYLTTRRHIPEDGNLNTRCRENLFALENNFSTASIHLTIYFATCSFFQRTQHHSLYTRR